VKDDQDMKDYKPRKKRKLDDTQRFLQASRQRRVRKQKQTAEELATLLTDQEAKNALTLTAGDAAMIQRLAQGQAPRNATAILGALKFKAEHTIAKPKQEVGVDGGLQIEITTIKGD
jgi:hypothetical protein